MSHGCPGRWPCKAALTTYVIPTTGGSTVVCCYVSEPYMCAKERRCEFNPRSSAEAERTFDIVDVRHRYASDIGPVSPGVASPGARCDPRP